nr:hypothetical protein [Tanacetum cinerariifolium]
MAQGLRGRMLMEHQDAQGQSMFTSRVWRGLFEIRGPLVHDLILEFFSMFKFGEVVLDLDTAEALQFQSGGVRRPPGPKRHQVAAVGSPEATDDVPIADESAQAILTHIHDPQPPPPAARPAQTMVRG